MSVLSRVPFSQEKSSREYLKAIKREETVLEKIRDEIVENEKKLGELSKQESDVLAEIYHIEKKIDLTDKLISELETDLALRQEELADLEEKIGDVQDELAQKQDVFYLRLRELYKRRNVHPLELVFGS